MNIPIASPWQRDEYERNKPLSDEELNRILPQNGYEIISPPDGYVPKPQVKEVEGFAMQGETTRRPYDANTIPGNDKDALPFIKPEDINYFSALLNEVEDEQLSKEEVRERQIMMLLLKVKNGTPPMRKSALKTITERAREFGAGPLFN